MERRGDSGIGERMGGGGEISFSRCGDKSDLERGRSFLKPSLFFKPIRKVSVFQRN